MSVVTDDDVTMACMKLCIARNDPSVSSAVFIDLIAKLARCIRAEFRELAGAAPAAPVDLDLRTKSWRPPDPDPKKPDDEDDDGLDELPIGIKKADAVTVEAARVNGKAKGGRPSRLSYDDRVRMRKQYDDAVEAARAQGKCRAPLGLLDTLAQQFNVPKSTVKGVLYYQDGN